MASRLKELLFFCAAVVVVNCNTQEKFSQPLNVSASVNTQGAPWPAPKTMTTSLKRLTIDRNNFDFLISPSARCDILQEAFVRYEKIIFGSRQEALKFKSWRKLRNSFVQRDLDMPALTSILVSCKCADYTYPSLSSDESYTLQITEDGKAMLSAPEVWGALRGLETFSQLIYQDSTGMYLVNVTTVDDAPRFKHRGLLLDTSRHYLSVSVLKDNLDIMAQNKFNVFHWHIVDDQAFPYESFLFPNMSLMGAYHPFTHVYMQQDVQEIVEYARLRGIRVIPEFDSPGHSLSWGKAIADLLTQCYSGGQFNGNYGPINPVPNTTYSFLTQFFSEIAMVFQDHYIHLGGDEVPFGCWQSNPDITAFMVNMGFGQDYSKLEQYYMQKLLNIVQNFGKGYMIWQEVIDNGAKVAPDTVVEVWKGGYEDELARVTALGYKALLASPWYLDYISIRDWPNYYVADPLSFNGTQAQKDLVMGGEACIWGEFVDDTNLISRLWPRASAIAERLWSPVTVNDVNSAIPRIDEHRCRLVRRGYPAEPLNGPSFCDQEYVFRHN